MNIIDEKDLKLFDTKLNRLLHTIRTAYVMATTMTQRMTGYKQKHPNADDAKIKALFYEELRNKERDILANYDDMTMQAITIGISFPFTLDEIINFIDNSII